MRLLVVFACLLLSVSVAAAEDSDQQQRLAAARQLVAAVVNDDRIVEMSDALEPFILAPLTARGIKLTSTAEAGIKAVVRDEVHKLVEGSLDDLAAAYAGELSLDDLKAASAFYTSEAGQKLLVVQPQLMRQFTPEIVAKMQADLPNLRVKLGAVFGTAPPATN